jgi:N-acetylmuramoyl-L-alanine amidase
MFLQGDTMKKWISAVMAALFLLTSGVPASAALLDGTIPLQDVSVVANGEKLQYGSKPFMQSSRVLVPAKETFERLGMQVEFSPEYKQVKITDGSTVLTLRANSKVARVNAKLRVADVAPVMTEDTMLVPVSYVAGVFQSRIKWDGAYKTVFLGHGISEGDFLSSMEKIRQSWETENKPTDSRRTVVIDAGHGGKDPGAIYSGVKEKALNLDIALRLKKLLQAEDINVQMTRETDSFYSLYERSAFANNLKADILVSIHNNAASSPYTTGAMTLYNPGTANSNGQLTARRLAEIVQVQLAGDLRAKSLGVIQRPNLAVLRTSEMPAVIAEIGFMTNTAEVRKLKTADYRQKTAEALKKAILKALKEI